MTAVFQRLAPYGHILHRALNSVAAFDRAERSIATYPEIPQVFEGDVCWNFEAGRRDLYFRRPSYVVDSLTFDEIDRQKGAKQLVTLDDLLPRHAAGKHYVLELKVGRGDVETALRTLLETMQRHCRDQFWIDGFFVAPGANDQAHRSIGNDQPAHRNGDHATRRARRA